MKKHSPDNNSKKSGRKDDTDKPLSTNTKKNALKVVLENSQKTQYTKGNKKPWEYLMNLSKC